MEHGRVLLLITCALAAFAAGPVRAPRPRAAAVGSDAMSIPSVQA
jgi:hypothetical protein